MSREPRVWVIDDDRSIRWVLERALRKAEMHVTCFSNGVGVMEALEREQPDAILSDIRMPGIDGLALLRQITARHSGLPVIIMTAHSDLDSAVSAFHEGAFEYLPKPFDIDEAVAQVARACRRVRSDAAEEAALVRGSDIIGEAPAMQEVFRAIGRLARSNITVLINGESGTGKELVARAIHEASHRAQGPLVAVNCGAIPDALIEAEFFGARKGAYTGATTDREGYFAAARGGTLFLDEIGDISSAFQAKLLRVLQEREFERVGGTQSVKVNVRLVLATNRNLERMVQEGEFRSDLYYRINVVNIQLPPLRERREDIPLMAQHFLDRFNRDNERKIRFLPTALHTMSRCYWPGNVRELENCMERAAVMSENGVIDRGVIELTGLDVAAPGPAETRAPSGGAGLAAAPGPANQPPKVDLDDPDLDERERVIAALEEAGWVQAKAARLLNMTPRQIAYRIQTLNIKVRQF